MKDQPQVTELCGVYGEMDDEGKKQMVKMAGKFLDVQRILDDEREPSIDKDGNEVSYET